MEIEDIEVQLEIMNDKIEDAKKTKAESDGAITAHKKRLKEEFGLDSEDDARLYVSEGLNEVEAEEKEIERDFISLKTKFGW